MEEYDIDTQLKEFVFPFYKAFYSGQGAELRANAVVVFDKIGLADVFTRSNVSIGPKRMGQSTNSTTKDNFRKLASEHLGWRLQTKEEQNRLVDEVIPAIQEKMLEDETTCGIVKEEYFNK